MFNVDQSPGGAECCYFCYDFWLGLVAEGSPYAVAAAWHNPRTRGAVISKAADYLFLALASAPFIYYLLVLYSSRLFFRRPKDGSERNVDFTPPVSNLKPVRGLDPEAYENFASYCRQDYPEYELIFCVGDENDPSVPVLQKLMHDFPERQIRILYGSGRNAINDKVAKLVRMVNEARNEVLVINDSDVRVEPNYLRTVVAPLRDPKIGGVTCLYVSTHDKTFTQHLQSIGMISDFYPGILVARQLDGIKFALELLPYAVQTVPDYDSLKDLFIKRLRWMTVMRHMRPWGHLGLAFTQGLPWCLAVALTHPDAIGLAYVSAYLFCRVLITWLIGVWGLKQSGLWRTMPLFIVWDATAFLIWLLTFGRNSIRWRNVDYRIREGMLVPVVQAPVQNSSH